MTPHSQSLNAVSFAYNILYKEFSFINIQNKKGNKKTYGMMCSGMESECDPTKGLSCEGPASSKLCLYSISLLFIKK